MLVMIGFNWGEYAALDFGRRLDEVTTIRQRVGWALEHFPTRGFSMFEDRPDQLIEPLREIIADPDTPAELLASAVEAAGAIHYALPDERIDEFLGSPTPSLRAAACTYLGYHGAPGRADAVTARLGDEVVDVRRAAFRAAANFAAPAVDELAQADALLHEDDRLLPALRVRQRAAASGDLNAMLKAALETESLYDAIVLSRVDRAVVIAALSDATTPPNQRVLAARVIGAAKLGGGWDPLTRIVQDRTQPLELRRECARMLGWMQKPSTAEALVNALDEADQTLADVIVQALGKIGNPLAFEPLLARWNQTPEDRRLLLAQSLRQVCDHDQAELEAELQSRGTARVVTMRMIDDQLDLHETVDVERVRPLLREPSAEVRQDAIWVLVLLGEEQDLTALAAVAQNDAAEEVRQTATQAAALLEARMQVRYGNR